VVEIVRQVLPHLHVPLHLHLHLHVQSMLRVLHVDGAHLQLGRVCRVCRERLQCPCWVWLQRRLLLSPRIL